MTAISELTKKLNTAHDHDKIPILNTLCLTYWERDLQQAETYAQQAVHLAEQLGDDNNLAKALWQLGVTYFLQRRLDKSEQVHQQALALRKKHNDPRSLAESYNGLAPVYVEQGRHTDALDLFNKALALYRQVDDDAGMGKTLGNIANLHHARGHYTISLDFHVKALHYREAVGDRDGTANTYQSIGSLYLEVREYELSIEYSRQALDIYAELNAPYQQASVLNNIAVAYRLSKKYDLSMTYQKDALALQKQLGDLKGVAGSLNNIGLIYYEQAEYEASIPYFQDALAMCQQHGFKDHEAISHMALAESLVDLGRYEPAEAAALASLALAREMNRDFHIKSACRILYRVYDGIGQPDKALDYHIQFKKMSDRLIDSEKTRQLTELRLKYETEKQEMENRHLREQIQAHRDQLTMLTRHITTKNRLINDLQHKIRQFEQTASEVDARNIQELLNLLDQNKSPREEWVDFRLHFDQAFPQFIPHLSDQFPALTRQELKICALIKAGLSTGQIAEVLHISYRSVESHRYRTRKKIQLGEQSLTDFIRNFSA